MPRECAATVRGRAEVDERCVYDAEAGGDRCTYHEKVDRGLLDSERTKATHPLPKRAPRSVLEVLTGEWEEEIA